MAKGTYKETLTIATDGVWTVRGGYDPKTFDEGTRNVDKNKTAFTGGTLGTFLSIEALSGQNIQVVLDGLAISRSVGKAPQYAGGIVAEAASGGIVDLTIDRVTMMGNRAGFGGAIDVASFDGSSVTAHVTRSVFKGNKAQAGGAISVSASGTGTATLTVEDTSIVGNSAGFQGGAVAGFSTTNGGSTAMTFRRVIFDKNKSGKQSSGGAIDLLASDGAGAGTASSMSLALENSILQGNTAGVLGSAVNLDAFVASSGSTATITADLVNNTIVANKSKQAGAASALSLFPSSFGGPGSSATITATMQNSIVYDNAGTDVSVFVQDADSHASLDLKSNNIGVLAQGFGTTVTADPNPQLSVDPGLVKKQGIYRLAAGSPMIGAGRCDGAPATDFEGHPRPTGTGQCGVDIGADQFVP